MHTSAAQGLDRRIVVKTAAAALRAVGLAAFPGQIVAAVGFAAEEEQLFDVFLAALPGTADFESVVVGTVGVETGMAAVVFVVIAQPVVELDQKHY